MVIKAVSMEALSPAIKAGCKSLIPQKFASLQEAGDVFVKSRKTLLQMESEIEKLKIALQDHKHEYNSLRNKLNRSFGDDWVFCYGDLTDKQSDMYIDCIAERNLMSICQDRIVKLTQELQKLSHS